MTTRSREIINELHEQELAELRAERDHAMDALRLSQRECEILRGAKLGVGPSVAYELTPPRREPEDRQQAAVDREKRMAMLEHAVRVLDATLFDVTLRLGECYCEREQRDDERSGCIEPADSCTYCFARRALKIVEDWRYGGSADLPANRYDSSYPERTGAGSKFPREAKMHKAWAKFADDFKLASILRDERPAPSARDWFVATSVVQWLATALGMNILEAAGFKYTQYDEDYETSPAPRASEQGVHP